MCKRERERERSPRSRIQEGVSILIEAVHGLLHPHGGVALHHPLRHVLLHPGTAAVSVVLDGIRYLLLLLCHGRYVVQVGTLHGLHGGEDHLHGAGGTGHPTARGVHGDGPTGGHSLVTGGRVGV